jgi:hypothetical protein
MRMGLVCRSRFRGTYVVMMLLLAPTAARADQGEPPRSPIERGTIGLEIAGGLYIEAWNLNDRRESLVEGNAAVWWSVIDNLTVLFEFHAMRVFQDPNRAAFVNGFAPVVRWHFVTGPPDPAPGGAHQWSVFAELGPGISWSDTRVPPRGTEFNYLVLAGTGLMGRLGRQTHLLTGFRWLHVSNNGLEGRARNPDIEAFGAYAGLAVSF